MGVIDTIAWVSYAVALNTSQLSITTAITESYPAIALFLGYWFNKERLSNYQFTGAFITILASLALAFII
jgi:drug/metabolite transporter (DMT)-like permease